MSTGSDSSKNETDMIPGLYCDPVHTYKTWLTMNGDCGLKHRPQIFGLASLSTNRPQNRRSHSVSRAHINNKDRHGSKFHLNDTRLTFMIK